MRKVLRFLLAHFVNINSVLYIVCWMLNLDNDLEYCHDQYCEE